MGWRRRRWSASRGWSILPYRGLSAFEEQDAAFFFGREAAATEVLERMSRLWRARACWWCRVFRVRASRRCCGRGCCRGSAGRGWRRRRGRRRGRAWCSPRPARRWMSWRCGWRCWRERTRRRCGEGWTPTRPGSRSPPARPPWHRRPGRSGSGRPGGRPAAASSGGCCWWSTSSSRCSPSAQMRGSGRRSSPPCARPPAPGTGRIRHLRRWSCWGCAPISRPAARITRSWPTRSRTATW